MGSISSGMSTGGRSSMCGSEEVIQIEGNVQQCVAALRGVATLLRGWQIRRVMTMQQGAMHMQQGGYGPGFLGPPPMSVPQQVPMSPTSTGGGMSGPMSPTSPGALPRHQWYCISKAVGSVGLWWQQACWEWPALLHRPAPSALCAK